MQNHNSYSWVRLTIKACVLALFILVLGISPLRAIDEARASLITFSEYPEQTHITNQYQNQGVVFSADPYLPVIVSTGYFQFYSPPVLFLPSPTIISFVDPIDGTPVEAVNAVFTYYILLRNSATFTFYDLNGDIISQQLINDITDQLSFPPRYQKVAITPDSSLTYVWIDDLSFQIAPKITLSRLDLMTIQAIGTPSGGTFAYNVALTTGANPPGISFVNGYTNTTNPNEAQLSDPVNPDRQGRPTAGGLSEITATYSLSGSAAQDSFSVPTFGMSCYKTELESDWGTPPRNCAKVKIGPTTYSGTITDPYGYPGTYCRSFIASTVLQGSGVLNSGQKIQYINGTLVNVDVINGSDGTPVVAGQTVARDRAIIPSTGVYVTVDRINNNNPLLANDTGGSIVGYRLDLYNGVGRSVCSGFNNVISVGACNPAQTGCPSMDIN